MSNTEQDQNTKVVATATALYNEMITDPFCTLQMDKSQVEALVDWADKTDNIYICVKQ